MAQAQDIYVTAEDQAAYTRAGQAPVRQGGGKVQQTARSLHRQQDNRVLDRFLPLARQQRPGPGG